MRDGDTLEVSVVETVLHKISEPEGIFRLSGGIVLSGGL